MTTPESERRARGLLWLLMVLLLAVVAAYLVYWWLEDDGDAGIASVTTLAATTTTAAPTTTTAAADLGDPTFGYADVDGVITLTGVLPEQASIDSVVAAAEATFGAGNVDNQMSVGAVGPVPWLQRVVGAAANLQGVPGLNIQIANGVLTLRGEVDSEDTKQALGTAAGLVAAPELTVDNQLRVVAATPDVVADRTQDALDLLDLPKITFETGSTNITSDGQAVLDEAAAILLDVVDIDVEVGGHTDSQGGEASNLSLSQSRADAVVGYLVGQGVDAALLTGVGYGEGQPVADNGTAEGRQQNRRIEFTVSFEE